MQTIYIRFSFISLLSPFIRLSLYINLAFRKVGMHQLVNYQLPRMNSSLLLLMFIESLSTHVMWFARALQTLAEQHFFVCCRPSILSPGEHH